ncbi:MAG TPA: hypothetical protein DDY54_03720 [Deltaproteobacteria bacterium]|nr:hypothetical protein [Deltaproteobacteria bacterium]
MKQISPDQEAAARDLELSYRLPEIVRQRLRTLEALSLKSGEHALDIGCGVGFLAHDMALQVGASGRVLGIDQNPAMLRHTQQRCAELSQAEFRLGEASRLPVTDQTLDVVSCTQVLLYVPDLAQVLAEIHRVLKPGGRVALVETDWRCVVLGSADDVLTRRIFAAWDATVANPNLPVHLIPLLKAQGFSDIRTVAIPIINTDYDPGGFAYDIIQGFAETARQNSAINETEARLWLDDLQQRSQSGSFFFCVNRFLFSAFRR